MEEVSYREAQHQKLNVFGRKEGKDIWNVAANFILQFVCLVSVCELILGAVLHGLLPPGHG